jgi:hypothetical protein
MPLSIASSSTFSDTRVNLLLGSGHFLWHFYQLCLPPLFIAWQGAFGVSFADLGLVMAQALSAQRVAPPVPARSELPRISLPTIPQARAVSDLVDSKR